MVFGLRAQIGCLILEPLLVLTMVYARHVLGAFGQRFSSQKERVESVVESMVELCIKNMEEKIHEQR